MRTQPILLTHLALVHLTHTLKLSQQWLLPMITVEENTAENFVTARAEWESRGLVEQDFDGSLCPQPNFSRLLYNITHARGAIRYENTSAITLYLRGPVDLLCLVYSKETSIWSLTLRPTSEVYHWAKTVLFQANIGELITEGTSDGGIQSIQTDFSIEDFSGPNRPATLNDHLLLFFEHFQPISINGG